MIHRSNIIYKYDGSFDGLMCCIFESYYKREIPMDIISPIVLQTTLIPVRKVETDLQKSRRVVNSIPKKIGRQALDFVRYSFLTCIPQKELYILIFLRKGYQYGKSVMNMMADNTVNKLFRAVKNLTNESHLIEGFLRFSVFNGGLVSQIGPKNYILPLITEHFCHRYPEEHFLIHDKTHDMALVYKPYKVQIIPIENLQMPEPDAKEQYFRKLWKLFYNTIEIKERRNTKCRMSNMPKRYWQYMTEFNNTI